MLSNHLILKNLPHLEVCRPLELSLPLLEVPQVVRPLEVCRHLELSLPLLEVPQVVRPLAVSHHLLMLQNHLGVNG